MSSNCFMCIHYACNSWITFGIFMWTGVFSKYIIGRKSIRTVVFWCILLDSLSLLVKGFGPYFGINLDLWNLEANGNRIYIIHTILCYMITAMITVSLIKTVFNIPVIYRAKYYLALVCILASAVVNIFIIAGGSSANLSLVMFIPLIIIMYIYTYFIDRIKLQNSVSKIITENSLEAIIVYDTDGKIIEANSSALSLFGDEIKNYNIYEFCERWNLCPKVRLTENFTSEIRDLNKMDNLYEVSYRIIKDKKDMTAAHAFIMRDLTEEDETRKKHRFVSTHDRLTELYNREYFCHKAMRIINNNPNKKYVIISIYVNQLELINDIFGLDIGNRYLRNLAYSIQAVFGKDALKGRIETDKFAVCMDKEQYSEAKLEKLVHSVIQTGGNIFNVKNYFGIYDVENTEASVSIMCDRAFLAIKTINSNNDKCIAYYNDKIRKEIMWEQDIANELTEALKTKQFEIYLQPQFCPDDNSIFGAEALVRWNHPERGLLPPSEFVPVFEKNGSIARLDAYVWEEVCALIARWQSEGRKIIPVSVNISPKDFYYINIRNIFMTLTHKYGIDSSLLRLEITESAVMINVTKQVQLIKDLQNQGFIIEMDDFGSGYSSLNALKNIPVDVLKADMKFLGISDDEIRSRSILQLVIELGHKLSMPVIVEGVEEQEEVDFLRANKCEAIQGFYYAKPMPIAEFEKLM